jgi:hypothetical protein
MKTISMKRAGEVLKLTRRAIYYRLQHGTLQAVKEGGARRIVLTPEMEATIEMASLTTCPHCGQSLRLADGTRSPLP